MYLEIIQYTLPVLIVSLIFYFMVRSFLKNDEQRRNAANILEHEKMIVPLRLQAYERIILFLERISPDSILLRIDQTELTCRDLQSEILKSIRSEFEHNITQQLYISKEAWEKVKYARDQNIQLVNMATEGTTMKMPALALSSNIMENLMKLPKSPSAEAIEFLKKEAHQLF